MVFSDKIWLFTFTGSAILRWLYFSIQFFCLGLDFELRSRLLWLHKHVREFVLLCTNVCCVFEKLPLHYFPSNRSFVISLHQSYRAVLIIEIFSSTFLPHAGLSWKREMKLSLIMPLLLILTLSGRQFSVTLRIIMSGLLHSETFTNYSLPHFLIWVGPAGIRGAFRDNCGQFHQAYTRSIQINSNDIVITELWAVREGVWLALHFSISSVNHRFLVL